MSCNQEKHKAHGFKVYSKFMVQKHYVEKIIALERERERERNNWFES